MPNLYWDIESRSAANLRECGAYVYALHPTTQPLCVAFCVDDSDVELWLPGQPVPDVFEAAVAGQWQVVAHAYDFERGMLKHVLAPRHGFPHIPNVLFHCTQRLALSNAYPAELDLLAQALGLPYRKDPAARKAMLHVSRPKQQRKRKPTTEPTWDNDLAKLALTYERCKLDVVTTRAVWQSGKLKPLSAEERRLQLHDLAINDRGILLDRAFAAAARDIAITERTAINAQLAILTNGAITTADQAKRFIAYINERGRGMSSLTKRAVAQELADKPPGIIAQLLELRRDAARASVRKYDRMLAYAADDSRMRGTLRMYGSATGRWSGVGPQPQNLKRNENNLPLVLVDRVRERKREAVAAYGNPLALLGDLSRAALCAKESFELKSADLAAIESRVLAWIAGEAWKLKAFETFDKTGDAQLEPYRIIARRMLHKAANAEVTPEERQIGKGGELAAGFGGGAGAWRRFVPNDLRSDEEISALIKQWRDSHPATTKFWKDLIRAIRVAIKTGQPILVAPASQPPIIAAFDNGNLTLTLPSGRAITYPEARLVPSKFENASPDVQFMDNARGQWLPTRGWFGVFIENVVQGIARDLLAAAIDRLEARGIAVVLHCHDDVVAEVPIETLSDVDFLKAVLEVPAWAAGLPIAGKVHSGRHYLEAPHEAALPVRDPLQQALDVLVDETREAMGQPEDPKAVELQDDKDFVDGLPPHVAPLNELVTVSRDATDMVSCPFHDDTEPSCKLYPDHYYCFGCGAHGDRVDWLTKAEGMTKAEAIATINDWPQDLAVLTRLEADDGAAKLAFVKKIWLETSPIVGTIAARYLDETRHVDMTKLPEDLHRCLRFHSSCVFGRGVKLPCLIAVMRDPVTDQPTGIQRIALRLNSGKVEKIGRRMLGKAGVVKLWPASTQLVCGEGLETVLAAATRIPFEGRPLTPAWALLSKGMMARLPIIDAVKRLVLLVDNDANGEGQDAATCAVRAWHACGREVVPLIPDAIGTDFNDVVIAADDACAAP